MNSSDEFHEIREIADSICDGEVNADQMKRLDQLLKQSQEAKQFYLKYVGMHAELKAAHHPQLEVVMRRSQTDELIIRPVNSPDVAHNNMGELQQTLPPVHKSHRSLVITLLILMGVCVALLVYILTQKPEEHLGHIVEGRLKDIERDRYSEKVLPGEYVSESATVVKLNNSSQIQLGKDARFSLFDANRVSVKKGELKFVQESDQDLILSAQNFKLVSMSKLVSVNQTKKHTELSLNSENELYPKRWRPNHYWSFDQSGDRALDLAGDAHGRVSKHVKSVEGLLGDGAYHFNNEVKSGIDLGNGGGTALATGSFAATDGVSIEALIQPEWSAEKHDCDEIFRKDMEDSSMRMLFSLMHDGYKSYVIPEDRPIPALTFGLYLIGEGYSELKLYFDGKEGRPSLDQLLDGRYHHVVASYDVRSGIKGIYMDGKLLSYHAYEPGTKMVSGGPGLAMIGNNPGNMKEPFTGKIDEVAFYNFALPDYMVKYHYNNTRNGLNYYGLKPGVESLPEELHLKLPENKKVILDSLTGLPKEVQP